MRESVDYLFQLARRAKDYEQTRKRILKYIFRNKIDNSEMTIDLFIMGFLWTANKRNESLRERDIAMFLGEDEDIDFISEINPIVEYVLDNEQVNMEFEELLDKIVSNYN